MLRVAKVAMWAAGGIAALVTVLLARNYYQDNWSLEAQVERACLAQVMQTRYSESVVVETRSFQAHDDSRATLAHYALLIELGQSRVKALKARIDEIDRTAREPVAGPPTIPSGESDYSNLVQTLILLSSLRDDLKVAEADVSRNVASRDRIQTGHFRDFELTVLVSRPRHQPEVVSALCIAPGGLANVEAVDEVQLVKSR